MEESYTGDTGGTDGVTEMITVQVGDTVECIAEALDGNGAVVPWPDDTVFKWSSGIGSLSGTGPQVGITAQTVGVGRVFVGTTLPSGAQFGGVSEEITVIPEAAGWGEIRSVRVSIAVQPKP